MAFSNELYRFYHGVFSGKRLPLAFVDLDAFDANARQVAGLAGAAGKTVRLGSKSIRCEALMRRLLDGDPVFRGFLTYTAEETAFLAGKGHDDFILAYPTIQACDLEILAGLAARGTRLAVMVDSPAHLQALSAEGVRAGVTLNACIEIDLAYRPFGVESVHLGLRRSPLRTPEQAVELARRAQELPGVKLTCLMGYEGHIAGVSDDLPGAAVKNLLLGAIKQASVRELTARRGAVVRELRRAGVDLEIVNGGGSGSIVSTLQDGCVTEVTVGSGFYAPGLFQHFKQVKYQPAAFFALQVVRQPAPGMVACAGGGYAASGPAGAEKLPRSVLPPGLKLLPLEGAGEVSTPLLLPPGCPDLPPGSMVFFQHAKAGELCERFDQLYLLKEGKIIDCVPTYRGEGRNFL